ncbi:MAG TPA: OB-fold nucleic acid binding domain-containing protein [Methanothrix soehngenii]|nr:OB-fold nucleic acid binding domain-containing protein [Methanothrix soehngenii]
MDSELEEIYRQVADSISPEEFEERVKEKVALMAGLCDSRTAAMLVARDLGSPDLLTKIGSIRPEMGNVTFTGRVIAVSPVREFQRSDGSLGRVANITLADETGSVRVALWDETAELIKSGDLAVDQCLKVRGLAKEGFAGTEVSLGRGGGFEEIDQDIHPRVAPYRIGELKRDMSDVSLLAVVVDPGEMREFERRDGGKGQVRGVTLGDETGKIRLTLWNEQAQMPLLKGETLEIVGGSVRERYGLLEIQTGGSTAIRKSTKKLDFSERMTPIAELKEGMLSSVSGFVSGLGEVREFQRDDGRMGRVANIYISDDSGRIRAALWGEHVDRLLEVDLGYRAEIIDAQVKSGWNEGLELSCGWRTRITFAPPE